MSHRNYIVHRSKDIEGIRQAARLAAKILDQLCQEIQPGMTTAAIDQMAAERIHGYGAQSAFYRYRGFPGYICISLNDEIVHGIGRSDRTIQYNDLVSLDVGVRFNGYIGDTARTIVSSEPADKRQDELLNLAEKSLHLGINAARYGNSVADIGTAIEMEIRKHPSGFSIVRDFVGHGCGIDLHEPPEIPNYRTNKAQEPLRIGMVLAIEPMINEGTHHVRIDTDGWTARTVDGKLSAHFEHMVLITKNNPEILTWHKKNASE